MSPQPDFDFLLPDVGEGLEEAEIVQWKVSVGQEIVANQVIVEIESAKSLVELPSPYSGTVLELFAKEGQVVSVGTAIIRIRREKPESATDLNPNSERTQMLVGSGPRIEDGQPQRRRERNYGLSVAPKNITPPSAAKSSTGLAAPQVRKFARELGIDLASVVGSGPNGSITHADVEALAGKMQSESTSAGPSDNSREIRTPIRGVRRAMADAMVASAFTAPHVTEFVTVDVSASMELLEKLRAQPEYGQVKLSPLTFLARAMCIAAKQTPEVNSFWDGPAQEIVTKHYVNLGIATATERGLLVPNIKDADQLSLKELAEAILEVVNAARAGKTEPAQMSGGTMSITNIGVFGIDAGTPIAPPGQSAIISLGAVVKRPWVVAGEIVIRDVTTLALSFDHRLVDGAQGSKFLADVAQILQHPDVVL